MVLLTVLYAKKSAGIKGLHGNTTLSVAEAIKLENIEIMT